MGVCQNEDSQFLSPGEEFDVHFKMNTLRNSFAMALEPTSRNIKSAKVNYVLE